MKRREFIAGLGASAWPMMARAQPRTMQVVGFLIGGTRDTTQHVVTAFHRGLSENGFVEGRNLAVEYRWTEDGYDRLPALADDLVGRQVAAILTYSTPAALAAAAASRSIPVVFSIGSDPVEAGLVPSLNQPGGNLTGIYNLDTMVAPKRLQLLHQLLPAATTLAYLVNPTNPVFADIETRQMQVAARSLGVRLVIVRASAPADFEGAFTVIGREQARGLVVGGDALFSGHLDQLVALADHGRIPTLYRNRGATVAGGLVSYGTDFPDLYRHVGEYAARILKGEKAGNLPVQQVTKLELVINVKTAKALGLVIPETLLATADEVIQ
jgi:putative tryptophan/tyrosine transport system substrate-binding protein